MKLIAIIAACLGLAVLHAGVKAPPVRPQHLSRVVHYNGDVGSASFCAKSYIYRHGLEATRSTLTCGFVGQEAEVAWQVVRISEEGDVYRFEFDIPVPAGQPAIQPQEFVFRGKPLVVYQDDQRAIVIEPYKPEDSDNS